MMARPRRAAAPKSYAEQHIDLGSDESDGSVSVGSEDDDFVAPEPESESDSDAIFARLVPEVEDEAPVDSSDEEEVEEEDETDENVAAGTRTIRPEARPEGTTKVSLVVEPYTIVAYASRDAFVRADALLELFKASGEAGRAAIDGEVAAGRARLLPVKPRAYTMATDEDTASHAVEITVKEATKDGSDKAVIYHRRTEPAAVMVRFEKLQTKMLAGLLYKTTALVSDKDGEKLFGMASTTDYKTSKMKDKNGAMVDVTADQRLARKKAFVDRLLEKLEKLTMKGMVGYSVMVVTYALEKKKRVRAPKAPKAAGGKAAVA